MPGIHFVSSTGRPVGEQTFNSALNNILHDGRYSIESIHRDDHRILSTTRYPTYPIRQVPSDSYLILLEGRIYAYSDSAIDRRLTELAESVFGDSADWKRAAEHFVTDCDGEFVIVMLQRRTGKWAVINDALGRLPLYTCEQDGAFIVSREIAFFPSLLTSARPDRLGLAQLLLIGFAFGSRTMLESVSSVRPATLISGDSHSGRVAQDSVITFDFDDYSSAPPLGEAANRLADLFSAGCRMRADGFSKCVVSLSGGLDSRSVVGGLRRSGCRFSAFTFDDKHHVARADVASAREIAARLSLDWHLIQLPEISGADVRKLFRLKPGLLNPDNAADSHFLQQITERMGDDTVYFSGDGGDTLIPRISPQCRSLFQATPVRHILHRYHLWSPRVAGDLAGVNPAVLCDSLRSVFESYPERSSHRQFMHFMVYEKAARWLFEALDRNRCALWAVTPFYSLPFFREVMSYPEDFKQGHRLYREFMRILSPEIADIDDPKYRLSPTSTRYERRSNIMSRVRSFPRSLRFVQRAVRGRSTYSIDSPVIRCIRRQSELSSSVKQCLDPRILDSVLNHPDRADKDALNTLLNITTLLNMLDGHGDCLDEFGKTALLQ